GFLSSSRRRHTRSKRDWSSDVCSSDLATGAPDPQRWSRSEGRIVARLRDPARPIGSPAWPAPLVTGGRRSERLLPPRRLRRAGQIGRASCREGVWISVVAGTEERGGLM